MYQFIESICCIDGKLPLLAYHQQRVDRTFVKFFSNTAPLNLQQILINLPTLGKYKCRIIYDQEVISCDVQPYENPNIQSLSKVYTDHLDYSFKFEDRHHLTSLFQQKKHASDMIIIRNELVTDSYFANLAFYDGQNWWTSDSPLLAGVRRQYLIEKGSLKVSKIHEIDILNYKKISLINAMLDLGEVIVSTQNVY